MYRCQVCGGVAPAHAPAVRLVLERRAVTYPRRAKANRVIVRDKKPVRPDDPGGVGWEIAREAVACPPCAAARGSG